MIKALPTSKDYNLKLTTSIFTTIKNWNWDELYKEYDKHINCTISNQEEKKRVQDLQKLISTPNKVNDQFTTFTHLIKKKVKNLTMGRTTTSLQGYTPNIPRVLQNHPLSMFNTSQILKINPKPVNLSVCISAPSECKNKNIRAGAYITYFLYLLLKQKGYKINLEFVKVGEHNYKWSSQFYFPIQTNESKINEQSLDILFSHFDLFYRGICFQMLRLDFKTKFEVNKKLAIDNGLGFPPTTLRELTHLDSKRNWVFLSVSENEDEIEKLKTTNDIINFIKTNINHLTNNQEFKKYILDALNDLK